MKSEELTRKAEEEISALISKKIAELRKKTGQADVKDKGRRGGLFYARCCGHNLQRSAVSMRRWPGDADGAIASL